MKQSQAYSRVPQATQSLPALAARQAKRSLARRQDVLPF
jgi:hypothetical protein